MPFSNKQSDIFYNDQTKEMFVCTVSAITAARCETGDTIYGALPIIYKIDKDTNYRQTIYPDNLDTFHTDENSDIFKLTPPCPVEDLNFDSITKPLINYNKDTSRYSVTFLGRFASDVDGLVINNYIFEDVDSKFHLLKAKSLLPQNSLSAVNGRFTFDSGYLNSDLYLGGNTVRNQNASWFNPADGAEIERSPNYMVSPTHVESTSAIGFNLIQDHTDTAFDALTGNKNFPLMFSGGYITVNPKYAAYDPRHTIRIDFRARSFNVPAPTAYASTQTVGNSASRWIQQYSPAGAGEGFCVYLFEQPQKDRYVVPNGVASTLGYSPADFNVVETAGSAQTTVGLFERNNWNPFKETYGCIGDGQEANSFIGVGFDIAGNFGKTTEDKPGWFNVNTTTPSPCSVSIRGNRFTNNQILTSVDLSAVPGSTAIPLHTSAADAVFVDYRVDLTNKGNRLTVSHKLTSSETYNTILDLRLNKIQGSYYSTTGNAGNVDGSNMYDPWSGFQVQNDEYPLLNIGLSFTTSTKVSQFELHSFEVKGVKVHNPWEEKIEPETQEQKTRIDYINKSSKNLRERLTYSELDDNVDIEMVIPSKNNIASELYERTNTTEITLCDNNEPEFIEQDVEVKYTGIRPEDIDTVVQAVERGDLIPEIGGGSIPRTTAGPTLVDRYYEPPIKESRGGVLPTRFKRACRTAFSIEDGKFTYPHMFLYQSVDFKYNDKTYTVFIRGIEQPVSGGGFGTNSNNLTTLELYEANINTLEERWFIDVANHPDVQYWELHLVVEDDWRSDSSKDYPQNPDDWFWLPKPGLTDEKDVDEFLRERNRGSDETTVCVIVPDNVTDYKPNWDPIEGTNTTVDEITTALKDAEYIDDNGFKINADDATGSSTVDSAGNTVNPPVAVVVNNADDIAGCQLVSLNTAINLAMEHLGNQKLWSSVVWNKLDHRTEGVTLLYYSQTAGYNPGKCIAIYGDVRNNPAIKRQLP